MPDIGVRDLWTLRQRSDGAQIFCRGFTRLAIGNNLERDLLSFVEPVHACAFDRADVHEYIVAAVIRLNEAEALLAVEPFHGSLRHVAILSCRYVARPRVCAAGFFEIWGENRQSDAGLPRGQVVRPKLDSPYLDYWNSGCKIYREEK
jgi:hypothetical protein